MIKRFIFSLSLSNLIFLKSWNLLLTDSKQFYLSSPPNSLDFLGLISDVFLIAVFFFLIITLVKAFQKRPHTIFPNIFVPILLLIPINEIRRQIPWLNFGGLTTGFHKNEVLLLCLLFLIILGFALFRWREILLKVCIKIVFILFPFSILTLSHATWLIGKNSLLKKDFERIHKYNCPNNVRSQRLLLLIFDETDERITFSERPKNLSLPELDRFRSQSIVGTNAFPPSSETLTSIPALTTGKLVSKAVPSSANELMVQFNGEQKMSAWSKESNIFSETCNKGYKSAVIAAFPPYCRIFGENISECFNESVGSVIGGLPGEEPKNFMESMRYHLMNLADVLPLELRLYLNLDSNRESKKFAIQVYQKSLRDALKIVSDPKINFIFIHWPIPHSPFIFNKNTGDFSLEANNITGYLDNLKLMDLTLGKLRNVMEKNDSWENTNILITSDHFWRVSEKFDGKSDYRVPFLLKLARQQQEITYSKPFNTILIFDLVQKLLDEDLPTPNLIIDWLEKSRSVSESPNYLKRFFFFKSNLNSNNY